MSIEITTLPNKTTLSGSERAFANDGGVASFITIDKLAEYFNVTAGNIASLQTQTQVLAAQADSSLSTINSYNNSVQQTLATIQRAKISSAIALAKVKNTEVIEGFTKALHRSPAAITGITVYDTSLDNDGGLWTQKLNNTSWATEQLCGTWLGQAADERAARGDNLVLYPEDISNGAWYKVPTGTGIAPVILPNNDMAPDGTMTADTITMNVGSGTSAGDQSMFGQSNGGLGLIVGALYAMTFWIKGNAGVQIIARHVKATAYTLITCTGAWQPITIYEVAGTSMLSIDIGLRQAMFGTINATATVSVWGFKLNKVGELPYTYQDSPELLKNGNFANGLTEWAPSNTWPAAATVANNEMTVTATTTYGRQVQAVNVIVGKTYCLSGNAKLISSNATSIFGWSTAASGSNAVYPAYNNASPGINVFGSASFVATQSTYYIVLGDNGNSQGSVSAFSNISLKEVTTFETPYVPHSEQINSYFQNTTNGKFYKLGATFGTVTEVYRGNKARFPKIAGIVAETNSLTIYDLTETDCPMWMRFDSSVANSALGIDGFGGAASTLSSVGASNGWIVVGCNTTNNSQGLRVIDFGNDLVEFYADSARGGKRRFNGQIGDRQLTLESYPVNASNYINGLAVEKLAIGVVTGAPVSQVTGLATPTVAMLTTGGVSVLRHDGTICATGFSSTPSYDSISIYKNILYFGRAVNYSGTMHVDLSTISGSTFTAILSNASNALNNYYTKNLATGKNIQISSNASGNLPITVTNNNNSNPLGGISSQISNDFATGFRLADARRNYICDLFTTQVSTTEIVTTPTVNNGWTAVGTGGTKIASGATGSIYGAGIAYNKTYAMVVTVTALSGTLTPQINGIPVNPITSIGTHVRFVTTGASGSAYWYIDAPATTTATVTSISVKEYDANVCYSGELVSNGINTTGWTPYNCTHVLNNNKFKVTNSSNGSDFVECAIRTIAGKKYQISVDILTNSTGNNIFLRSCSGASINNIISETGLSVTGLLTSTFIATTTSTYVSLGCSSLWNTGQFFEYSNFSVKEVQVDRSVKGAGIIALGLLNKSPVAQNAQLVSINSFTATKYLQEKYPDTALDLGTTAWSTSAYINAAPNVSGDFNSDTPNNPTIVGQELVTNGSFTNVANGTDIITLPGWSAYGTPTTRTINGNVLTLTANATNQGAALTFTNLIIGKTYRLSATVGTNYFSIWTNSANTNFSLYVGNSYFDFVATATTDVFYFRPNGNTGSGTSAITNISVREISNRNTYPFAQAPSVLTNGDFSNGLTGWTTSVAGSNLAEVVNGRAHISCVDGVSTYFKQFVTPGFYRVTADIEVISGSAVFEYNYSNKVKVVSTLGKSKFDSVVYTDSIVFRYSGNCEFYFDNVECRPVTPTGANIVPNGTFANGVSNWTLVGTTAQIVGNELEVTATTASGQSANIIIPTVIGKAYYLTGTARSELSNSVAKSARIRVYNNGSYDPDAGDEVTVNGTIKKMKMCFTAQTTSVVVYLEVASINAWGAIGDKAYFSDISVRELTDGIELCPNSGFSGSITGWTAYSGSTLVETNGTLEVISPGNTNSSGVYQTITTVIGKSYLLSYRCRRPGADGALIAQAYNALSPYDNYKTATVTTKANWITYTLVFTPITTSTNIFFANTGSPSPLGSFFLDDVSVKEVAPVARTVNTNLLPNGNFNNADGWTYPLSPNCTIANGSLNFNNVAVNQGADYSGLGIENSKQYLVTYTVSNYVAGGVYIYLNGTAGVTRTANGTYSEYITSGTAGAKYIEILSTGGFIGSVDNVSINDLSLGTNLLTNGGFDTNTVWNMTSNWSIANGVITSNGGTGGIDLNNSLVVGKRYKAITTILSSVSGSVSLPYDGAGANLVYYSTPGTYVNSFIATSTNFRAGWSNSFIGSIDNVMLFENEHDGNLISNGKFDYGIAGWTTAGSGSIASVSNTMRLTCTPGTFGYVYQVINTVPGKSYQVSGLINTVTASNAIIYAGTAAGANDLLTLVVTSSTPTLTTGVFTASYYTTYISFCTNAAAGLISQYDNISVREVTTGENIIPDNNFTSSTGWVLDQGWTVSGGVATGVQVTAGISKPNLLTIGKMYKATITIASIAGGTISLPYDGNVVSQNYVYSTGTFTHYFQATSTTLVAAYGNNFSGTIDNISIMECLDPTVSVDGIKYFNENNSTYETVVNLINANTEDYTGSDWTKRGTCTITNTPTVANASGEFRAQLVAGLAAASGGGDFYNTNYNTLTGNFYQPFITSFSIKRVSTSGVISVINPVSYIYGEMRIDLSKLDNNWNRIYVGHPAVTLIAPFVFDPGNGYSGFMMYAFSGAPLSFYLDQVQVENSFNKLDKTLPSPYVSVNGPGTTLGPNLVVNGNFATDTNWNKDPGWTISSGTANKASNATFGTLVQSSVFTSGKSYKVCVSYSITSGTFKLWNNGTQAIEEGITASANKTYYFNATTSGSIYFEANASAVGTIDNVTVEECLWLGPELNTNPTFTTDLSGWTTGSAITSSVSSGEALVNFVGSLTATGNNWFTLNGVPGVVGNGYYVQFDATWVSGGDLQIGSTWSIASTITAASNAGTKKRYNVFVKTTAANAPNGAITFGTTGTASWKLDNISVKQNYFHGAGVDGKRIFNVTQQYETVYGAELVTNGNILANTTGWTAQSSTLSAVNGNLRVTATTNGTGCYATTPITTVPGKTYRVIVNFIKASVAQNVYMNIGTVGTGGNGNLGFISIALAGTIGTIKFTAIGTTTYLSFNGITAFNAGDYFEIDGVSATEIITNPAGFGNELLLPTVNTANWTSATTSTSTDVVNQGELYVTATAALGTQYQSITTVIGSTYEVAGIIRKVSGGGSAYVALSNGTGSAVDIQTFGTNNTTTETQFVSRFVATATTSIIALRVLVNAEVGAFRNISVREVKARPSSGLGLELIPNNDYKYGLTGYVATNSPVISVKDGYMYFSCYTLSSSVFIGSPAASTVIGKTYKATVKVKRLIGTGTIQLIKADSQTSHFQILYTGAPSNNWNELSIVFQATSTSTYLLMNDNNNGNTGSTYQIGPLSLTEVTGHTGIIQERPGLINKLTSSNFNPTVTTGLNKAGSAAATLTVVNDAAALALAGLSNVCTNGNVFKVDNSTGITDAYVYDSGLSGSTNTHTFSVYARCTGTNNGAMYGSGVGFSNGAMVNFNGSTYKKYSVTGAPSNNSICLQIGIPAGTVVYFILQQMVEGASSSTILVSGTPAASPLTVIDDNNVMYVASTNENRINTKRRVQNLYFGNSESPTGNNLTIGATTVVPYNNSNINLKLYTATTTAATYINNSTTIVSGKTYTVSLFVKAGTSGKVIFENMGAIAAVVFDVNTGTISGLVAGVTAKMIYCNNGVWRCQLTVVSNRTTTGAIYLDTFGTSTAGISINVGGIQIEDVTGRTNTDAGEYVSVNTSPTIFGSETVSDTGFATPAYWTTDGNWAIYGGRLNAVNCLASYAKYSIATKAAGTYRIQLGIESRLNSDIAVRLFNNSTAVGGVRWFSTNALQEWYIEAEASFNTIAIQGGGAGGFTGSVSFISVVSVTTDRPEMVINGAFDTVTGWSMIGGGTLVSTGGVGVLTNNGTNIPYAYQTYPTIVGKVYKLVCTITSGTAVTPRVWAGGGGYGDTSYGLIAVTSGTNTLSFTFIATGTATTITLCTNDSTNNATCSFDNLSLKEVIAGGTELVTNGSFEDTSNFTLPSDWYFNNGKLVKTTSGSWSTMYFSYLNVGSCYELSLDVEYLTGGGIVIIYGGNNTVNNTIQVPGSYRFRFTNSANSYLYIQGNSGTCSCVIDNVSLKEILPSSIIDRSFWYGAYWNLGLGPDGRLIGTAYDGTTKRIVTGGRNINTGENIKAELTYDTNGTLSLYINGKLEKTTTGTALLTLNNSQAVFSIGNIRNGSAPFVGSISQVKVQATSPTASQVSWIYNQEKMMFAPNAIVGLPNSSNITDMCFDNDTGKWTAVQANYKTTFNGLVVQDIKNDVVGGYSRIATTSSFEMVARPSTSPGVDVTAPSINTRAELLSRRNGVAQILTKCFDYVATTGQTAFILPAGWTTTDVISNGTLKQFGTTKDYTTSIDNFCETVNFAVAPGNNVWVQIQAIYNPS